MLLTVAPGSSSCQVEHAEGVVERDVLPLIELVIGSPLCTVWMAVNVQPPSRALVSYIREMNGRRVQPGCDKRMAAVRIGAAVLLAQIERIGNRNHALIVGRARIDGFRQSVGTENGEVVAVPCLVTCTWKSVAIPTPEIVAEQVALRAQKRRAFIDHPELFTFCGEGASPVIGSSR